MRIIYCYTINVNATTLIITTFQTCVYNIARYLLAIDCILQIKCNKLLHHTSLMYLLTIHTTILITP
jgi:hypothetical protein